MGEEGRVGRGEGREGRRELREWGGKEVEGREGRWEGREKGSRGKTRNDIIGCVHRFLQLPTQTLQCTTSHHTTPHTPHHTTYISMYVHHSRRLLVKLLAESALAFRQDSTYTPSPSYVGQNHVGASSNSGKRGGSI